MNFTSCAVTKSDINTESASDLILKCSEFAYEMLCLNLTFHMKAFLFFFFFFFFGLSVAQITHVSTYAWLYYHHSQPFFFFFLIKYIYYLFIFFYYFFFLSFFLFFFLY